MSSYVDFKYYTDTYHGKIFTDEEKFEEYLRKASRHIDTLTYNRIVAIGFDNLTQFQQKVISEVICLLVDFEYENADMLESILSSYSINGVNMDFANNGKLLKINNVFIPSDTYSYLEQSGLTCKSFRRY